MSYRLYTIDDDGSYPTETYINCRPEETWPQVLEDMAKDFVDHPDILQLWLNAGVTDEVQLWRRS